MEKTESVGVDAVEQRGKGIEFNLPLLPLECHRQRGGFEVEGCRPTSTDRYSYRCPKPYPFCSRRRERREKKKRKEEGKKTGVPR